MIIFRTMVIVTFAIYMFGGMFVYLITRESAGASKRQAYLYVMLWYSLLGFWILVAALVSKLMGAW